jgi:tetratricopeptide (TPR) repeat protein
MVDALLRHGVTDEAGHWMPKLEKAEPDSWRTASLKARVLHAQGKDNDAVALLQGYGQKHDPQLLAVALLLEQIGQVRPAEELYRKLVSGSKQPELKLGLAAFLARQHRVHEALDVCEPLKQACAPEMFAGVVLSIVYNSSSDAADRQRAGRWIEEALEKNPNSVPLLGSLATLRSLEGRYDEAEKLYHRAMEKDKKDPTVLNNLAWLLGFQQGKQGEALELIQAARDLIGPVPDVLDTRAVIYLQMGRGADAIKDLEEVVTEAPSPMAYFHLAQAHLAVGNRAPANAAWEKAKGLGFRPEDLHPLEKRAYQQVIGQLEKP